MATDVAAIDAELATVRANLRSSWRDLVIFCKAKIMEAAMNGNVASYSIGGRSVTRDLDAWERWLALAQKQAAIEDLGGVGMQTIYFSDRR
jgi:hypothetical protein